MKQKVNFSKEKHATSILDRLEAMRKEKKYCDFKIKVGTEVIEAHRNILAAGSDYFDAMLSHDTKENSSGIVELIDVDAECVKICLDFIYNSEVNIPDENYEQMLYASHLMQLQELCNEIANCIGASLDVKSFFATKRIATMFECKKLEEKCEQFAEENFLSISNEAGFGESEKSFIIKILKSKKVTEEEKLDALLLWVKSDGERKKVLVEMMQCLDLNDVPVGYRRYLLENDLLLNNCVHCFRLLSISVMDSCKVKSRLPLTASKSSLPENSQTAIVVFDENSSHLQRYDPRNGSWKQMQEVDSEMIMNMAFSAVALESHIYVLFNNTVLRLDISDEFATWKRMADMLEDHGCKPPATDFGGCIYVLGGPHSSCVEKYDPMMNQWNKLKDRPRIISDSAATELGGEIYCVGGRKSGLFSSDPVNMVEGFNVASSEWTRLAPINKPRYDVSCATMGDKIYALGGRVGNIFCPISTVECYDVASNLWTMLKPVETWRFLKGFAVDGVIYAVSEQEDFACSVEKYDIEKNEWEIVSQMNMRILESVKAVVVD